MPPCAQPDNIGMQCFDFDYFDSLTPELKTRMIACARSGFENPDSGMGAYAIQPDDYDVLTPYLDACIRKYHKVPAGKKHVNNWSLDGVAGLPADGKLDVTKLGLGELSMRYGAVAICASGSKSMWVAFSRWVDCSEVSVLCVPSQRAHRPQPQSLPTPRWHEQAGPMRHGERDGEGLWHPCC